MKFLKITLALLFMGHISYGQVKDALDILTEKRVKKAEASIVYKPLEITGRTIQCQRTTEDQRKKLSKKKDIRKAIADLEALLEVSYQKAIKNEPLDSRPGARESQLIKTISRAEKFITMTAYETELERYKHYQDMQISKASEERVKEERAAEEAKRVKEDQVREAKKTKEREEEQARIAEKKRILEEKKEEAKKAAEAKWAATPPSERAMIKVRKDFKEVERSDYYGNGYYFNKVYQGLADAQAAGASDEDILPYIQKMDEKGKGDEDYISFNLKNLNIMSTASQKKRKEKIDNLKSKIDNITPSKATAAELRGYYNSLIGEYKYYLDNFSLYKGHGGRTKVVLAKLEIEHGNRNSGCSLLYNVDISNFIDRGYHTGVCEAWYKKKSAQNILESAKEEKAAADKWRKANPGVIVLKSLLGEYEGTIEAYLGKPTKQDYQVSAGRGIYTQSATGNTYSTPDGTYQVGYSNGKAILIDFTPAKSIKFDKELFKESGGLFDFEDKLSGACSGFDKDDFIGGLKIFTTGWDCGSTTTEVTFFGDEGKLVSVSAH
ncbi:MAG: hypothetical protein Roseis2KO_39840 [Roseivirga sp.]